MGRGYSEVITYSFVAPDMFEKLLLPEEDPRNHPIKVLNPISNELSCMRTFLLPGLLQSLVKNVRGGWKDPLRIFESGRVFLRSGESHLEPPLMGGIVYAGKRKNLLQDEETFYRVKGDLLAFCESANAQISFRQASEPFGHGGQTGHIYLGESSIGYLARLKPSIEDLFDLGAPVYAFEIEIAPLLDSPKKAFGYTARYPGVYRDISLLVDARHASASEVLEKIHFLKGEDARSVLLFDAYEGKGIPEGKRSLSFSVLYRHQEKTLSDEEVDGQHVQLRQGLGILGLYSSIGETPHYTGGVSMHTQLQEIEQIVERALEKMEQLRRERQELLGQIEDYEKIVQEKDLELIRLRKEQQRLLETKEREAMHLLKEQGQVEQKIKNLVERFENISQAGNFA